MTWSASYLAESAATVSGGNGVTGERGKAVEGPADDGTVRVAGGCAADAAHPAPGAERRITAKGASLRTRRFLIGVSIIAVPAPDATRSTRSHLSVKWKVLTPLVGVDHSLSREVRPPRLKFIALKIRLASMRRIKTAPRRSTLPPALADETVQLLAEQLLEAVSARVGSECGFAEFEQSALEISNEVCRQAIKKNSKR
jgi:hypothetical protein